MNFVKQTTLAYRIVDVLNKTDVRSIWTGGFAVKNTIEYKDYVGNVEFSEEDEVFFGKVIGIRSLISYEGATVREVSIVKNTF